MNPLIEKMIRDSVAEGLLSEQSGDRLIHKLENPKAIDIAKFLPEKTNEDIRIVVVPYRKWDNFSEQDLELIQRHLKLSLDVESDLFKPDHLPTQTWVSIFLNEFPNGADYEEIVKTLRHEFRSHPQLKLSVLSNVLIR
ncbi:hypothetical protein [Ewingella americana]|uniref:Uncharacterized protein n=1 Tax=Ewingella americana TaxID=41202 RepID=A0A502GEU4_9GAMM|nr:hypothetical protein [Ewingella americana]TPG60142.1 hypothetical protein EAH77_16365 [Ewingella americana]